MKEIQLEIRTQKQTRIVINVYDRESRFFLVNTFWRLKGLCNVRSVVLSRKTSNFHSNLYNFSRQQFLLSYTTHYVPRGKLLYNIHGIPIHLIINSLNTNSFWSNVSQMLYNVIQMLDKSRHTFLWQNLCIYVDKSWIYIYAWRDYVENQSMLQRKFKFLKTHPI